MTLDEIIARARELDAELAALASKDSLSDAEAKRFDLLAAEVDTLSAQRKAAEVRDGLESGRLHTDSGVGIRAEFATTTYAAADNAVRALDRGLSGWKGVDDDVRHAAYETVQHAPAGQREPIARHVLLTGSDAYRSAFAKYVGDPVGFGAELTEQERAAWSAVRKEQRATLLTTGAVLPSPLDPSIILSNSGTNNPFRALSRSVQTTSDHHRFITSAGVTASFDAEEAEVSDDTPTLTEVQVNVETARAWVEASIEAAMDQPNLGMEVAAMFGDAKDRLEGTKFWSGAGTASSEPEGIETALIAAGTAVSIVPAAGEAIAEDDWYGVLEDLSPRWRQQSTFVVELSTLNAGRKLYVPNGSDSQIVFDGTILGRPYALSSDIDPNSGIDAGANGTSYPVVVGDFSQFAVVDRIGMTVDYAGPAHVLNTSGNLPDGRVGWFAYWRVGSKVLVPDAFRLLRVITAA